MHSGGRRRAGFPGIILLQISSHCTPVMGDREVWGGQREVEQAAALQLGPSVCLVSVLGNAGADLTAEHVPCSGQPLST